MKVIFQKKNLRHIIDGIMVIAGTFLMGFAFNVFLNNNKISPSGFAGLSAIISNMLASNLNVHIPASVFYLAINAVLFVFAYKNLGLKFAINSALGIISYSIFMQVANFDIGLSGTDLLLCAIYGGVVMGIGLGLVFRGKGSTGGSDMLANLLNKKFKFITVGNMVFIVDVVVIALSLIAYKNLELSLYSLIAIWIMTKMADIIISGVQSLRAYYIISDKHEEISNAIMNQVSRGVTGFKSQGMYTKQEKNVLMTVVTKEEAVTLKRLVASIDKGAFVFSSPISEARGTGFIPLENKQKNKVKKMQVEKLEIEQNLQLNNAEEKIAEQKEENKTQKISINKTKQTGTAKKSVTKKTINKNQPTKK